MKYMLLTYLDEKAWLALSPEEQARQMSECGPHIEKLMAAKKILGGRAPPAPTSTATTVRYREGKRLLTDGPFAETREQLGRIHDHRGERSGRCHRDRERVLRDQHHRCRSRSGPLLTFPAQAAR